MRRIDHACMPQQSSVRSRIAVGVKRVNAVAFRRHINDVVRASPDRHVRHIQRLRINIPIHSLRKQLSKSRRIHIGRSQNALAQILSRPSNIIVLRKDTRKPAAVARVIRHTQNRDALRRPHVACIDVNAAFTPLPSVALVATPAAFTDATPVFEDVHVALAVRFCVLPSL